jgi:hypothetical protein
MDERFDTLTDDALDRQLAALLDVRPSPDLVARLRTRIDADPLASRSTWRRWAWVPATAAIIAVAVVIFRGMPATAPERRVATIATAPSPAAVPQDSQKLPPVPPVVEPPSVGRSARPARTRPGGREPAVLVSPREADGVRYLLRVIRDGRLDASTWPEVSPVDVAITGLAPIEIEPLMAAWELEIGEAQ